MKKTIRNVVTDEVINVVEANPVCMEDFCEICGDCLHCYGEDPCTQDGGHYWVKYEEE